MGPVQVGIESLSYVPSLFYACPSDCRNMTCTSRDIELCPFFGISCIHNMARPCDCRRKFLQDVPLKLTQQSAVPGT